MLCKFIKYKRVEFKLINKEATNQSFCPSLPRTFVIFNAFSDNILERYGSKIKVLRPEIRYCYIASILLSNHISVASNFLCIPEGIDGHSLSYRIIDIRYQLYK